MHIHTGCYLFPCTTTYIHIHATHMPQTHAHTYTHAHTDMQCTSLPPLLTSTAKLVRCVVLHSTGRPGLLSCMIPSEDHPPLF